jgi:hypothetical protein
VAGSALQVGADVASTMAAVSAALEKSVKTALRPVVNDARKRMRAAAGPPTGGDRRYSNRRGYNHGGRLDVTANARDDLVFVGSKGPWKIAEEGASPHRVNHPGTRGSQGRSAWSRAADPIVADAESEVPRIITEAVEGAFSG